MSSFIIKEPIIISLLFHEGLNWVGSEKTDESVCLKNKSRSFENFDVK